MDRLSDFLVWLPTRAPVPPGADSAPIRVVRWRRWHENGCRRQPPPLSWGGCCFARQKSSAEPPEVCRAQALHIPKLGDTVCMRPRPYARSVAHVRLRACARRPSIYTQTGRHCSYVAATLRRVCEPCAFEGLCAEAPYTSKLGCHDLCEEYYRTRLANFRSGCCGAPMRARPSHQEPT